MTKEITSPLYFAWSQAQIDIERYKPSKPTFIPSWRIDEQITVWVVVDVPVKHEYIDNAAEILRLQLVGEEVPPPILTVEGLRYCEQQLLDRSRIKENEVENNNPSTTSKNDFDDELTWED